MQLPLAVAADFALVLARTMAWLYAAPVFGDRNFSGFGRFSAALAMSVFITPLVGPSTSADAGLPGFVALAVGHIAVGLLLGWVASAVMSAFEAAGSVIDLLSGFSVSMLLDPASGNQAAVFARFARVLFVTLLFATGAYQSLVGGFTLSFRAVPVDRIPQLLLDPSVAVEVVGTLMVSALQIAAPVLGALFLTEVALAVAQRFAPTANVFIVGLPLKTLVTLTVLGASLAFWPVYLSRFVEVATRIGSSLIG